ncbi:hypothetical protein OUZ56_001268 [Daphnia magna]|uniref:Uncharacterized protein n=1 Tax=Daphnia magna TaxID=35525 RepID=A0ABR0A255_9CRUS|nr:hypothetical protein OUZ56_001268 [Daphnia magna]
MSISLLMAAVWKELGWLRKDVLKPIITGSVSRNCHHHLHSVTLSRSYPCYIIIILLNHIGHDDCLITRSELNSHLSNWVSTFVFKIFHLIGEFLWVSSIIDVQDCTIHSMNRPCGVNGTAIKQNHRHHTVPYLEFMTLSEVNERRVVPVQTPTKRTKVTNYIVKKRNPY